MSLTRVQLETLVNHLKRVKGRPDPLEELRSVVHSHHGLYQEEGDQEGAAIYKPLVDLADKVSSIDEVEKLLQELYRD